MSINIPKNDEFKTKKGMDNYMKEQKELMDAKLGSIPEAGSLLKYIFNEFYEKTYGKYEDKPLMESDYLTRIETFRKEIEVEIHSKIDEKLKKEYIENTNKHFLILKKSIDPYVNAVNEFTKGLKFNNESTKSKQEENIKNELFSMYSVIINNFTTCFIFFLNDDGKTIVDPILIGNFIAAKTLYFLLLNDVIQLGKVLGFSDRVINDAKSQIGSEILDAYDVIASIYQDKNPKSTPLNQIVSSWFPMNYDLIPQHNLFHLPISSYPNNDDFNELNLLFVRFPNDPIQDKGKQFLIDPTKLSKNKGYNENYYDFVRGSHVFNNEQQVNQQISFIVQFTNQDVQISKINIKLYYLPNVSLLENMISIEGRPPVLIDENQMTCDQTCINFPSIREDQYLDRRYKVFSTSFDINQEPVKLLISTFGLIDFIINFD